ncbi:MAG: bifunctional acetaldehyde-CoA/alcohol dehydrogenase [Puniceicoccales bacterium]|jgi:acetaldehyde dehydrogenase/alcohol dehydrogenase|nr:bifunctional acetaldehyde-CoA/alcohol dehydrogenase [Puniceicoccales bacterium]
MAERCKSECRHTLCGAKTLDELEALIGRTKIAQAAYGEFSQEKVNAIFYAAAKAANQRRIELAEMAVNETGMGIVEDKVIKNHFAAEYIYNKYKYQKTCGTISHDRSGGHRTVAAPLGVIAGVIPTTNPTSTAIFKSLIALKTRNGIIFSPHPRAKGCTVEAARIVLEAALGAGAPENIMGWIEEPTLELTNALMKHPDVQAILATGGPAMVAAAYGCGKPAIGVGSGNTPAIVDETADIRMAASTILLSKTFDCGVICASEQSVIAIESIYGALRKELIYRGAHFLSPKESKLLGAIVLRDKGVNPAIVGQRAAKIAELAGFSVPDSAKILVSEEKICDGTNPFAHEKLSPVLALFRADNFQKAVAMAVDLVNIGGLGHTSVLYTDPLNDDRIDYFAKKLPTGRLLINCPASQGGVGDLYNFRLEPSLTLGCGSWGHNSVSENVGTKHLLNYKTVAERRENMLWFRVPQKIYFKRGSTALALREYAGRRRAFIVTDKFLFDSGGTKTIVDALASVSVECQTFFDVKPDPTLSTVRQIFARMQSFGPDLIIGFGGGSPMDAAKIAWLLYEHPEINFQDIAVRFMDIRKRVCAIPPLGAKAQFVAIPTTSGTGSEVTPFAVITDDATHIKYPIADYALTPSMAIVDPDFVDSLPKGLTAAGGIDALVHAVEAYVSSMASPFSNANAIGAISLIFKYLPRSYKNGGADMEAREEMHYAATIAGMAFANAFLGLCHSMAHKLGAAFNIAHGIANALVFRQVIAFNATDCPRKQAAFPQYKAPEAVARYGQIAKSLGLDGKTDEDLVKSLIGAIQDLMVTIEIPLSIKAWGVKEDDFMAKLDSMAKLAFDDQCTSANPAYPSVEEIRGLYLAAFAGKV